MELCQGDCRARLGAHLSYHLGRPVLVSGRAVELFHFRASSLSAFSSRQAPFHSTLESTIDVCVCVCVCVLVFLSRPRGAELILTIYFETVEVRNPRCLRHLGLIIILKWII
jgi:hypothetical protein